MSKTVIVNAIAAAEITACTTGKGLGISIGGSVLVGKLSYGSGDIVLVFGISYRSGVPYPNGVYSSLALSCPCPRASLATTAKPHPAPFA